jgi:hypothetical protein
MGKITCSLCETEIARGSDLVVNLNGVESTFCSKEHRNQFLRDFLETSNTPYLSVKDFDHVISNHTTSEGFPCNGKFKHIQTPRLSYTACNTCGLIITETLKHRKRPKSKSISVSTTKKCDECGHEVDETWDDSGMGEQWCFGTCSKCGKQFSPFELEDLENL